MGDISAEVPTEDSISLTDGSVVDGMCDSTDGSMVAWVGSSVNQGCYLMTVANRL